MEKLLRDNQVLKTQKERATRDNESFRTQAVAQLKTSSWYFGFTNSGTNPEYLDKVVT